MKQVAGDVFAFIGSVIDNNRGKLADIANGVRGWAGVLGQASGR